MLVSMNQVLKSAVDRQCCIGAFDTPSLEILMAVLGAAEKRNEPVIVQHAQLHDAHGVDALRSHQQFDALAIAAALAKSQKDGIAELLG